MRRGLGRRGGGCGSSLLLVGSLAVVEELDLVERVGFICGVDVMNSLALIDGVQGHLAR